MGAHEPILNSDRLLGVIELQNAIVAAKLDVGSVMQVVVDRAGTLTGASGAVVELVESDEMVYRAVAGSASRSAGLRLKRSSSLSGLCVEQNAPLWSDDTSADVRVDQEACRRVGVASMICVPLIHQDRAVGVLKVVSDRTHTFSPDDVALLKLLGSIIAASIHHAEVYVDAVHESLHDALTGLANRRAFDRAIAREIARVERYGSFLSVAMLDLDGLKAANDRFGHAAGDAALKEAAAILGHSIRSADAAFRLGGDEFAVLMPATVQAGARFVADRCTIAIDRARLCDGAISVSAGTAEAAQGESAASLLARADAALYDEKRRKKAAPRTEGLTR